MNQQILSFVFFIQLPSAIFVYIDSRRRQMQGSWMWILGVLFFMPFFLPFYVLLRPRATFIYCRKCKSHNILSSEKCRRCGAEFAIDDPDPDIRGEWDIADVIAIFTLSMFTLPISFAGISVVLGIAERDSKSWIGTFSISFVGTVLLLALPIWFILKVCTRPLKDLGWKGDKLYRNIGLGLLLVIPVLFIAHYAEEIIVRAAVTILPSQVETIQKIREEEHKIGSDMFPESPNELLKIIGSGFLLVVMAPLGEEVLFRGMAYTALKKRSRRRALIITSLLFAIAHLQIIHFIPVFLVGLILAYLFEYTGSLVSSITLHALVNLILMIIWYVNPGLYT